jgi:hypothetical protein
MVMLAACRKGPSAAECREQADALTALLREANSDPPVVSFPSGTKLVTRTDLPRSEKPPRGMQVLVGDPRPVAAQLDAHSMSQRASRRALFVIGQDTPWRDVVDAFEAAKQHDVSEIGFAFAAPVVELKPPPRSSVDDQLDQVMKGPESDRATGVAELMTKPIARCASLKNLFGAVSSDDDKAAILIEGTRESLIECSCNADIPAIRSLMWRVLANPTPTRVLIVGTKQPATRISAKADAPWKDVQARLTQGMTSVALAVD